MDITAQLKAKGHVSRSRIGVMIQDMGRELATSFGLPSPNGALISQVTPGGAAGKAGLHAGDVVLKVNGRDVTNGADLQRAISSMAPGSKVTLDVWGDKSRRTVTLVTDELKEEDPRTAQREYRGRQVPGVPENRATTHLGLALAQLAPEQLSRLGVRYGLLVRAAHGISAKAGLVAGDVIVGVGSRDLDSLKAWDNALVQTPKNGALALKILRQGQTLFLALPMTETAEE